MKKKILILALVALCAMSFLTAGNIKADVALGTQDAGMMLNFKQQKTSRETSMKSTMEANVSGVVDIIFNKNIGMNFVLGTDFKQEFKVGTGFLYMTSISTSSNFSTSVGPYFIFGGDTTRMGLYVTADFDFNLTKAMFLRVGTGMDFEFLQIKDGDNTTNINIDVPLPRLALGWRF